MNILNNYVTYHRFLAMMVTILLKNRDLLCKNAILAEWSQIERFGNFPPH